MKGVKKIESLSKDIQYIKKESNRNCRTEKYTTAESREQRTSEWEGRRMEINQSEQEMK